MVEGPHLTPLGHLPYGGECVMFTREINYRDSENAANGSFSLDVLI